MFDWVLTTEILNELQDIMEICHIFMKIPFKSRSKIPALEGSGQSKSFNYLKLEKCKLVHGVKGTESLITLTCFSSDNENITNCIQMNLS